MNYPLINGNRFDFSSVEFNLQNVLFAGGVKEMNYKHKLEPGKVYSNHAQPIGRTRGQYTPEAGFTMYKSEYQQLVALLGPGYMEVSFPITVMYAEPGSDVVSDVLMGCRIMSDEDTGGEGGDPLAVAVELDFMYLIRNGVSPINPARFLL